MNIPNCIPDIAGNEIKYLKECIDTKWISSVGPYVDRFETLFSNYHHVSTATAVSSGTAAIHLALKALNVNHNDMVLCPTVTFIGTVNPIFYLGAEPVFIGVESETLNIDIESLVHFFQTETIKNDGRLIYKKNGRLIKAMIVVHLYGNPANMDMIIELSNQYNIPVLEDAAESLGAKYNNRLLGTIGDIGCFSFNGNKIITTGGGGMIISRDEEKTLLTKHMSTQAKTDSFEFLHDQIGYNYRLSNLCAAVGVAQMESLDDFIQKKRQTALYYKELFLKNNKLRILEPEQNCFGTYWMTLTQINPSYRKTGYAYLEKIRKLSKQGLGVRPIWYPLHKLPIFKDHNYFGKDNSSDLYQTTFCLPSSVSITNQEMETTVSMIDSIV
jgi:aminotransferase in exopolysaccharide biosynthesis